MIKKYTNTISAIIPAFNEAKTIDLVIREVLKLHEVKELIVVDDGSTDKTREKLEIYQDNPRFVYVCHTKNRGKGAALRTGVKKAKKDIVLLLDADLMNITTTKIRKIIRPVLKDEVDIARAGFRLARGRVTEMAVKPMMSILFPHLKFDQPISGQICAKKSFLEKISFENRWGVDIGILFDAIYAGARMVEVNIGKLEHKARKDNEKAEMAKQVLETMIKKAGLIQHKYKLITFDLDEILLPANSMKIIHKKLMLTDQMKKLKLQLAQEEIDFRSYVQAVAALYKGKTVIEIDRACANIPLTKYAFEVIAALKRRKYQVAIVSSNFSPIIKAIAKRLEIETYDGIYFEEKNSTLTGKVTTASVERWTTKDLDEALNKAFLRTTQRLKIKPKQTIAVALGNKSTLALSSAGMGICYKSIGKELSDIAVKTINVLPEILAIVE